VADAFTIADNIHNQCRSSENWNEPYFVDLVEDDVPLDGDDAEDEGDANFDPHALEAIV
jgi:hypothetical protein